MKAHQFARNRSPYPSSCCPAITTEQRGTVERPFCKPVNDAKKLPQGRTAQVIIFLTVRKASCPAAPSRRPEAPIMVKPLFRKRPRFPSFHPCRRHRDPVNSACWVWNVTAYFFKALSPEKLASASNVVLPLKAVSGGIIATIFRERCSRNATR